MTTPTPLAHKTYLKALLLGYIDPLPADAVLAYHVSEYEPKEFFGYVVSLVPGSWNKWEHGRWEYVLKNRKDLLLANRIYP